MVTDTQSDSETTLDLDHNEPGELYVANIVDLNFFLDGGILITEIAATKSIR